MNKTEQQPDLIKLIDKIDTGIFANNKELIISIKNEINLLNKSVSDLKNKNKTLKEENANLRKKNKSLSEKKEELETDNILKEKRINNLNNEIIQLKQKDENNYSEIKNLEDTISKIKEFSDKSKQFENKKAEDFYDIVIDINSIKHLDIGWIIKMTEIGKQNYEKYKHLNCLKIGVIGNENKGKSTILKRISNFELPTGVSIKTEGLSIKYPIIEDYPNLNIVLLDSVGLEAPVLKYQENKEKNEEVQQNENKDEEKRENGDIYFAEQSRDKLLTEIFLQTYIIKNSDILLLVFGKLSCEEQKLLNKIKNDMNNVKRKEPLMIIHNLKEYESISQIEDYINNTLYKSITFNLQVQHTINKSKEKNDWKYFVELDTSIKIYHLIYAKEGTEAGDSYNKKTIDFIMNSAQSIPCLNNFDIIDSIQKSFCLVSESILENPIKADDLVYSEDKRIKLRNPDTKLILKKCLVDELGISNFLGNGFEPKYDYYLQNNKFFVNVELPGDYEAIEGELHKEGIYSIITISGNKKNNIDKIEGHTNFFNKRDYGNFSIRIKLEKINLRDEPEFDLKDGVACFIYSIDEVGKKKNFLKK